MGKLFSLMIALLLVGCAVIEPYDEREAQRDAGLAIQEVYERALPTLSEDKQRHFAQRLYRLTGEQHWRALNHAYGVRLLTRLEDDIVGLAEPGYAAARSRAIIADYSQRTAKQRARRAMLGEWGEIAFARGLLFRLAQAEYHGLLPAIEDHERALGYLAEVDWAAFLTDPAVIGIYAAQVANQAYFLHQLGVMDLRREVEAAFRRHYPPDRVADLDDAEYRNWLYGLTHFVIADSRYYQRKVDPEAHAWVLEVLARETDNILARATADIQAEVALAFLLADREDHPLVGRVREALVAAVDPASGIIPSHTGETGLAGGEHRNVLAIMVLRWPGRLHPGPDLSDALGGRSAEFTGSRHPQNKGAGHEPT
ncbi:DUF3541 domain-containing protein [Vreelandella boliviensis]|uniref:DUF3541 domain-containing protein n=1 Tax=Vreelandella boliviensis LC1 TaxID=1072583 RepID=A0ABX4G7F1_9GAMM|nr:DUF3541 domain-containing protein [Halomonas boliviensis]OZT73587.1 hypothetical protein CE457_13360 [Halomonas boliviensis LC1]